MIATLYIKYSNVAFLKYGLVMTKVERRKLEEVLENPQVIKTPVVRNGKQSTLGYQLDVWKGWN